MGRLRQCDSTSPYLFVLVMEELARLLAEGLGKKDFKVHPKCKGLGISHLCFADNVLIFIKGEEESLLAVRNLLSTFSNNTDLFLNLNKTSLLSAGLNEEVANHFVGLLNCQKGKPPFIYLGTPLVEGRLFVRDCLPITERIS